MLYARVSLSSSRLCHIWRPQQVCVCVVTSDAHEALFRCNHLGCIVMMLVALCIPFPFFCFVRWYAYYACLCHPLAFYASLHACLHIHAWVLLVSVSFMLQHNEVMDIRSKPTFVPHRHHLWFAFCLFVCYLSCLFARILISLLVMSITLICFTPLSNTLCTFSLHCLSTGFLSLSLHVQTWSKDAWS